MATMTSASGFLLIRVRTKSDGKRVTGALRRSGAAQSTERTDSRDRCPQTGYSVEPQTPTDTDIH